MRTSVALVVVIAALSSGCRDECERGEAKCEGNTKVVCEYEYSDNHAPLVWRRTACADKTCVVATTPTGHEALCALGAQPEPRCAVGKTTGCDGSDVLMCAHGFALARERCAGALVCALPAQSAAFCAKSAATDPRCGQAGGQSTCGADGTYLVCREGFVVKEGMCPAGQRCAPVASDPYDLQCVPG
jgi:hypothetical protein